MRRSSAPMAATTVADSTNAVEVADLLKEAVAAGTASEAVRSVLSSDEGAEFAELLVQQLGERVPPKIDGAEEVEKLKREVVLLQKALAAKDATRRARTPLNPLMRVPAVTSASPHSQLWLTAITAIWG